MLEPMEEEIVEIVSPLDEKEESDEQKEEEWISYTCLPSNESNSLTHTLFDCPPCSQKEIECYDPIDSFETSLFDKNDLVIYDNPLFATTNEMHDNEELCL